MIVCHCNRIDHLDIEAACAGLLANDPWKLLTPVSVYKALGKRPQCGGCLPLAANLIHSRGTMDRERCATCPMADPSAIVWSLPEAETSDRQMGIE